MKSLANGMLLQSNTVTPLECLHHASSLPTSVVITRIDSMAILEQALKAVETFEPLGTAELDAVLAKTAKAAAHGELEPLETRAVFDSSAQNPAWLGEEPERLRALMPV